MTWLNPGMLTGFAALAVPIIFHFIARHKFPIKNFPSILLLRKRERPNALSIRPIDLLQLLLRLAVLAILVAAMGRGFLPNVDEPAPRNLVIIVDSSTSMNLVADASVDEKVTSLDKARSIAREMLEEINLPSRCALIAAGTKANILSPLGEEPAKAIAALDTIEVGAGAGDNLVHSIAVGAEMIRGLREHRSQIVVLSDGRTHSFRKRHERDLRLINDLKEELGEQLDVTLVDLAKGDAENIAIVHSEIKGRVRRGRDAHVLTRVRNFGAEKQSARIEFAIAGEREPMYKDFALEPGTEALVDLTARPERTLPKPFAEVSLKIPDGGGAKPMDDSNLADNSYSLPFVPEQVRRILIVDGTELEDSSITLLPGEEPEEEVEVDVINGSRILEFVLNPSRELGLTYGTGLRTMRIPFDALATETLSKYDLVALYDVGSLSDELQTDLRTYVQEGRALLLVCSAQMNALTFNNTLASGDDPLSPVMIDNDQVLEASTIINFDTERRDIDGVPYVPSALVSNFLNLRSGDLSVVSFNILRGIRGYAKDARILLRDNKGNPLVIDRPLGDGRVAATTFGMELNRGNLAMSRVFPLLSWTLIDHLTGQLEKRPSFALTALRPASLDLSEPGFAFMDQVEIRHEEDSETVRQMKIGEGKSVKMEGLPPGQYMLGKPWGTNDKWIGYRRPVTVNADPLESDMTKVDLPKLGQWLGDSVTTRTERELAQMAPTGQEQWRLFVLILAALWVLESVTGYVTGVLRWRKQEREQEKELEMDA